MGQDALRHNDWHEFADCANVKDLFFSYFRFKGLWIHCQYIIQIKLFLQICEEAQSSPHPTWIGFLVSNREIEQIDLTFCGVCCIGFQNPQLQG